jgi:hypothetical protein
LPAAFAWPGSRAAGIKPPRSNRYAASSHIAVSNALLINGMLTPKFALAAFFDALLGLSLLWATSAARSHDPYSWERATEKNRSI